MKKLITILLLFPLLLQAKTIYVAIDGDNGAAGTIAAPYLTISYAQDQLRAGDTLYVRGGTYAISYDVGIDGTYDGTAEDPICVFAYPDDHAAGNVPIWDASSKEPATGVWIRDASYWKFWGITVQRALQGENTTERPGWLISRCDHIYFEQCVSRWNEGQGYKSEQGTDRVYFINCDAYGCFNWYADYPSKPGGAAGGFVHIGPLNEPDTTQWGRAYYYGCRAWGNSDNGISAAYCIRVKVDRCWVFNLGWQLFDPEHPFDNGDGRGFPQGMASYPAPADQFVVTNSIAAYNKGPGFNINSNSFDYTGNFKIYNNVSAYSREYGFLGNYQTYCDPIIFRNNIAYGHNTKIAWNQGDAEFSMEPGMTYTSDHNSWDAAMGFTITDADFVSVDTAGMSGARQADGSLPDVDFMKLAEGSALIGAGVGVGLTYDAEGNYHNDPPDLGPYAYDATDPEPPFLPELSTSITSYNAKFAYISGTLIDDGTNGENVAEISATGFVWSTSANPTILSNIVTNGTRAEATFTGVIRNLSGGTTYHIRSYATNQTGTAYGEDVSFTTPEKSINTVGGKRVMHDGKIVIIK